MSKAPYWITLTTVVTGLYLYRNWGSLPEFHLSDAFGLAFIGLIVYWISRPSLRRKDAADS
jgi:hypothetical protein